MNYTELTAAVVSSIGNTFDPVDMARLVQLAEETIYNAVQLPALRKNMTSALALNNPYVTLPSDFLYPYSFAVIDPITSEYQYLLNKDVNYLREMYPAPIAFGMPRVYAQFDKDSFLLAPSPDQPYAVELHFGYLPESIVTAGTSWLGDHAEGALYNGTMVEAARFIKEEQDVVALYDKQFGQAMTLLKQLGDGKIRQDTFRVPQVRDTVR